VLGGLDIAGHPEGGFGVEGQLHQGPPCENSTQVSFDPPPGEEFTTSEFLRSATRVRPPGRTQVSLPVTAKGRRSIWRGSMPSSQTVGQTDRPITGWLMKLPGSSMILARVS